MRRRSSCSASLSAPRKSKFLCSSSSVSRATSALPPLRRPQHHVAHVIRIGCAVDESLVVEMRDERLDRVLVLLDPLGERLLAERLVLCNRLERDPLLHRDAVFLEHAVHPIVDLARNAAEHVANRIIKRHDFISLFLS